MTRRDYVILAGFLRDMKPINRGEYLERQWSEFVGWLCARLKQDNPRFDEAKFREACERGDNYHDGAHNDNNVGK